MPRMNSFARQFQDLHGIDAEVFVRPQAAGASAPLSHWPWWLKAVVLTPIAIALIGVMLLMAALIIGASYVFGSAFFGAGIGTALAIFSGFLVLGALAIGFFGDR